MRVPDPSPPKLGSASAASSAGGADSEVYAAADAAEERKTGEVGAASGGGGADSEGHAADDAAEERKTGGAGAGAGADAGEGARAWPGGGSCVHGIRAGPCVRAGAGHPNPVRADIRRTALAIRPSDITIDDGCERQRQGATCEVSCGQLKGREGKVAIKHFRQSALGSGLLEREIAALEWVSRYDRVVTLHGVVFDPGARDANGRPLGVCLAMDWYPMTLAEVLYRDGRLRSWRERMQVLVDVAVALAVLHGQHPPVVHRDVKPGNVLLDMSASHPRAVLGDFGLAAEVGAATCGGADGTPGYRPPEVLRGEGWTPAGDVYAVGMLLYEAVARKPAWEGTGGDVVRARVRDGRRPVLPDEGVHSFMYRDLYERCVAQDPRERPEAADALAALRVMLSEENAKAGRRTSSLVGASASEWAIGAGPGAGTEVGDELVELRPGTGLEESMVDLYGRVSAFVDEETRELLRGGRVASVVVRRREAMVRMVRKDSHFVSACRTLGDQYRSNPTAFARQWDQPKLRLRGAAVEQDDDQIAWRRAVMERVNQVPDWSYGALGGRVKVSALFHGVKGGKEVAMKILRGGFADLARTDRGWFGAGVYLTPSMEYARDMYANRRDADPDGLQWVLLVAALHGHSFPVIGTDALEGQPLVPGHDSHVAVVSMANRCRPARPETWGNPGDVQRIEVAVSQLSYLFPVAALGLARRASSSVPDVRRLESAALRRKVDRGWALWDEGKRKEAVVWWGEACAHPAALCMLLLLGEGGEARDEVSGGALLVGKAERDGAPGGLICEAGLLLERGGAAEQARAAELYRRGADRARHARCLLRLGLCYVRGVGVAADAERGVGMVTDAAERGLAEAMWELGRLHEQGTGVERDGAEALELMRKAARGGCSDAAMELGRRCEAGEGVERDLVEAVRWYKRGSPESPAMAAAERLQKASELWGRATGRANDVVAMEELAALFAGGEGVERNPKEAERWWRLAAQYESAKAMWELGRLAEAESLLCGEESALDWYRPAALHGHTEAQFRVGQTTTLCTSERAVALDAARQGGHARSCFLLAQLRDGSARKGLTVTKLYAEALALDGQEGTLWSVVDANGMVEIGKRLMTGDAHLERDDNAGRAWLRLAMERPPAGGERAWLQDLVEFALGGWEREGQVRAEAEREARRQGEIRKVCAAAEKGDAAARVELGRYYENGSHGMARDLREARRLYQSAGESGDADARRIADAAHDYDRAEKGDADAMFGLALRYSDGQGVGQDVGEAVKWYELAVEKGHAGAMNNLGLFYLNGRRGRVRRNHGEAMRLFQAASERGSVVASRNMGDSLYDGWSGEQSSDKAVQYWTKAANDGDADSMARLWRCFRTGEGCAAIDHQTSTMWCIRAARRGSTVCQGVCYAQGLAYGKVDKRKAVELYRQAAREGDVDAMDCLGNCLATGDGVARNPVKAVEWYRQAAKKGHAEAMHNLGLQCFNGNGVARSWAEAVTWWRKSAGKGHADAMCNLGLCYARGEGVRPNQSTAVVWYEKAAEKGNATAMNNLGWCHERGTGVASSLENALAWYQKAAEAGAAMSMTCMAHFYSEGLGGLARDEAAAQAWLENATRKHREDAGRVTYVHFGLERLRRYHPDLTFEASGGAE